MEEKRKAEEMEGLRKGITIRKYVAGVWTEVPDVLALEAPLTIFFNDEEIVTLLCTPSHVEELAVGFLAGEGFLKGSDEMISVAADQEKGLIWVNGKVPPLSLRKTFLKRYLTSGCGKGTTFYNLDDAKIMPLPVTGKTVNPGALLLAARELQVQPSLFKETGATHGALLLGQEGVVCFREDIGRHNAVDKILGKCFRENIPLADKSLVTTGRISSEILLKTAKLGIGVLASRSAPTSLAVELAQKLGVTVVGFARGDKMNVYTFPERLED